MDSLTLWQDIYGPRWAAMREREQGLREQAFVSWTGTILGEPVRQMTLGDMLILQGAGSPFIDGKGMPEASDVMQFIWALHVKNTGSRFARGWHRQKMIHRLMQVEAVDPVNHCIEAVNAHLDDVFQDAPRGGKNDDRPLGVCFMASLLVRLGSRIGAADPATGEQWAQVPLARIFQYMKAINRDEIGKEFKDFSPSDKVMSDWLDHSNRLTISTTETTN